MVRNNNGTTEQRNNNNNNNSSINIMSSSHTDLHSSSEKTKTKANKKKSAASSFGFKSGFLNTNSSSTSSSSSVRSAATTTTATVAPPSTVQPRRATSTAAAAAPPEPALPSTEDPHEECVLCCYPLPVNLEEILYKACCGEDICLGCIIAQQRTLIIGTNVKKPIAGSREEELEFATILASDQTMVCPFCRTEDPINTKELRKKLWKRIDEDDDPNAMILLGNGYLTGDKGLSKNLKKAEELYQQAYNLGDGVAAYHMANLCTQEIPDQARMMKYLEEGVKRGNTRCMVNLGIYAAKSGNQEEAKRCFTTAARSGCDKAVRNLVVYYQEPGSLVSKDDLATTLRVHKAVNDARKTEPREYAIRHRDYREKMISTGKIVVVGDKDKPK